MVVDTEGSTAGFVAVDDDVVSIGKDVFGLGVELVEVLVAGTGERMVLGHVFAFFPFYRREHREVDDPEEVVGAGLD